jgi:phenylpropionate dioxygenase-like ring-hydroxylating dioxygenase large terminal subunit
MDTRAEQERAASNERPSPRRGPLLSGAAYADDQVFEHELLRIFHRTWQYVGREDLVRAPGTFFTTVVGREPILVLRGHDGQLRAFHNVCPHRGARLLEGAGACKAIVCPYHAWRFNQDGSLANIPKREYFGDVPLDEASLAPASVDIWRGFVFVNPLADAPPLLAHLGEFVDFLGGYSQPLEDLRLVTTVTFDEAVNWKIVVENYVEDYHFTFLHPGTLKVFDFDGVRTLPTGPHIRILMPYRKEAPQGHCKYPWEPSGASYQGYIFPNLTVQTAGNHVSLFKIVPVSARRTIIEIPIFQTPEQAEKHPLNVADLEADVKRDMEEDFVVCRNLQRNVSATRYRTRTLAGEHELGVAHFQKTWSAYVDSGRAGE